MKLKRNEAVLKMTGLGFNNQDHSRFSHYWVIRSIVWSILFNLGLNSSYLARHPLQNLMAIKVWYLDSKPVLRLQTWGTSYCSVSLSVTTTCPLHIPVGIKGNESTTEFVKPVRPYI